MPRMAISELVSKPRPNMTPRGYIFHGRSTMRNSFRNTLAMNPTPSRLNCPTASSSPPPPSPSPPSPPSPPAPPDPLPALAASSARSLPTSLPSTHALPAHSTSRNAALTAVPTTLPTREKPSKRSRSAPLVAATTTHVTTTTVEWPSENHVPTDTGRELPPALANTRRRVVRSMAAMWSASSAWRSPSV